MGASISQAHGMGKSLGDGGRGKFVAVIGDSTFLHGGINPLMNTAYNKSYATTILLDNRTTGMTGSQEHPGTGFTVRGEKTHKIDSSKCMGCKACVNLGCPAISFQKVEGDMALTKDGKKRKGISNIEPSLCPGCHLCYQVCN